MYYACIMIYTLPNRAFLRLSGPDAERYLNGQITQKVAATHSGQTLWTTVTNAKGGIEGVGNIRQIADGSYLFDCPIEISDEMEARLDRYLIADDCEWVREDDRWQILVGVEESTDLGQQSQSNRYRQPITEVVCEVSDSAVQYEDLPEEEDMKWRAINAVPTWGVEIQAGMLPAECGLYDLALSFDKGCYIGQEIISRMETAGRTRSKLYQAIGTQAVEGASTQVEDKGVVYSLVISKKEPSYDGQLKSF